MAGDSSDCVDNGTIQQAQLIRRRSSVNSVRDNPILSKQTFWRDGNRVLLSVKKTKATNLPIPDTQIELREKERCNEIVKVSTNLLSSEMQQQSLLKQLHGTQFAYWMIILSFIGSYFWIRRTNILAFFISLCLLFVAYVAAVAFFMHVVVCYFIYDYPVARKRSIQRTDSTPPSRRSSASNESICNSSGPASPVVLCTRHKNSWDAHSASSFHSLPTSSNGKLYTNIASGDSVRFWQGHITTGVTYYSTTIKALAASKATLNIPSACAPL